MWILSILILILILGIIILVHEFGHFIWAKKFKVHIYEFSIGMGPVIYSHKGKDNIDYNLRAVPIGGFVSMAGEVYEDDDSKKIPKKSFMCNKPWWQRLIILVAGVVNNFLLALVLLFVGSLIWGRSAIWKSTAVVIDPIVEQTSVGLPMASSGIQSGDKILAINNKNVSSWDIAQIILVMKNKNVSEYYFVKYIYTDGTEIEIPIIKAENVASISKDDDLLNVLYKDGKGETIKLLAPEVQNIDGEVVSIKDIYLEEDAKSSKEYKFEVKHENGDIEEIVVSPAHEKYNDIERDVFGLVVKNKEVKGIWDSLKNAFSKFANVIHSMWLTVTGLITGKISLSALSGPVGMYQVVDQARSIGFVYLVYITAFLSINVGFINILPFPAFDGGRVFFLIVEKLKGSPVNSKFESICHTVGFTLLLLLMIYITIQDIVRLF